MTVIYGIKNCDTMKKAVTWLQAHNIDFIFHDYKKGGVSENVLMRAMNNASIIKRPLLCHKGKIYLGFKDEIYQGIFA